MAYGLKEVVAEAPAGVAPGLGLCCNVDVRIKGGFTVVDGDERADSLETEGAVSNGLLLGWAALMWGLQDGV